MGLLEKGTIIVYQSKNSRTMSNSDVSVSKDHVRSLLLHPSSLALFSFSSQLIILSLY